MTDAGICERYCGTFHYKYCSDSERAHCEKLTHLKHYWDPLGVEVFNTWEPRPHDWVRDYNDRQASKGDVVLWLW